MGRIEKLGGIWSAAFCAALILVKDLGLAVCKEERVKVDKPKDTTEVEALELSLVVERARSKCSDPAPRNRVLGGGLHLTDPRILQSPGRLEFRPVATSRLWRFERSMFTIGQAGCLPTLWHHRRTGLSALPPLYHPAPSSYAPALL